MRVLRRSLALPHSALSVLIVGVGACDLAQPSSVPTTVIVTPSVVQFGSLGRTGQLSARVEDQNGQEIAGATVTWTASPTGVATVAADGVVTGVGKGATTVTASTGSVSGNAQVIVRDDGAALMALYQATDGANWLNNSGWASDLPLDEWFGIEVNGHGGVTGISFDANGLRGRIPPELGDLAELKTLVLIQSDGLVGSIPPELGDLANLEYLYVRSRITGEIPPELGDLANLELLDFAGDMTGEIPPELSTHLPM